MPVDGGGVCAETSLPEHGTGEVEQGLRDRNGVSGGVL